MKYCLLFLLIIIIGTSCTSNRLLSVSRKSSEMTGSEFYKKVMTLPWDERESIAKEEILKGNMPSFLKKMKRVSVSIIAPSGKKIQAYYYVTPDYLSIGSNHDFARIPLTPITAQDIADSFNCFLPTRKMVNDIYQSANVKLEPMPMFAFRDSAITMYQHHLIIEGLRDSKTGLIAGIKKDVVMTNAVAKNPKPNRVAIYGWHTREGKAIQPLYTGHVNWYVDYSHGIRLVHQIIYVENRPMNYQDVLKDPILKSLLCDESDCDIYRYPTSMPIPK